MSGLCARDLEQQEELMGGCYALHLRVCMRVNGGCRECSALDIFYAYQWAIFTSLAVI